MMNGQYQDDTCTRTRLSCPLHVALGKSLMCCTDEWTVSRFKTIHLWLSSVAACTLIILQEWKHWAVSDTSMGISTWLQLFCCPCIFMSHVYHRGMGSNMSLQRLHLNVELSKGPCYWGVGGGGGGGLRFCGDRKSPPPLPTIPWMY